MPPPPRWLARAALALVLLGVAARLLRYALRFPIWGDEAFVGLNLLDRDYVGLTRQLDCGQVAPLLFLWVQKAALEWLGSSEYSLRLLPLLAGLGGLLLFWRLARAAVAPLAACLAVSTLAVARWPVTMSANLKPYSLDLFFAVALLTPAVCYLRRPDRTGWLLLLALTVPVALLTSYPAVFVAGGVFLAVLPAAWRAGGQARGLLGLYGVLLLAGFLTAYLLVGLEQLDPEQGTTRRDMQTYWRYGFPPGEPLALARWLLWAHTSWLFAYPAGGDRGGSVLTALACAVGVWRLARDRRRDLLVLLLAPFALGLVAAALRAYPYGAGRLSQHLAPAVCLLAGVGVAALLEGLGREASRARAALAVCALLAAVAVAGMAADLARPYRDLETRWAHGLARELRARAAPGDHFVVLDERGDVPPLLRWHLSALGPRLSWGAPGWGNGPVWTVKVWALRDPLPEEQRRAALPAAPAGWARDGSTSRALPGTGIGLHHYAVAVRWRPVAPAPSARYPAGVTRSRRPRTCTPPPPAAHSSAPPWPPPWSSPPPSAATPRRRGASTSASSASAPWAGATSATSSA